MKVLVNTITTKKITGGAFQIALNFLLETLSDQDHQDIEWLYVTSSDLDAAVGEKFSAQKDKTYFVFPTQPDFKGTYKNVKKALKKLEHSLKPDIVYTITAPSYFTFDAVEVMRFTNPWVAHPNSYAWKSLPLKGRIKTWLYCQNQKRLMRHNQYFITQAEATKKGIIRITGVPEDHVKVISNVLPATIASSDNTRYAPDKDWIDIACVGTPMSHKNQIIVPEVIVALEKKYGIKNIRFHLTMRPDNNNSQRVLNRIKQLEVEDRVVNHGQIPQKELIEVYKECQYAFLPTLLEVFSATSLEAMYFDLPIVATDFPFNKNVIGDAGLYCIPNDAEDAADKLYTLIHDEQLRSLLSTRMKNQLQIFNKHQEHFASIIEFLELVNMKEHGFH